MSYNENMLTNEDIQKLLTAFQEIFATKEDLTGMKEELRSDFSNLETSIDAYAHKADKYFQEMAALATKVDRLDRWIHEIADKVGIELKS